MPHRSVRRKVQILAAMMPLATCSLFGLLSLPAQALAKSITATAHPAHARRGRPAPPAVVGRLLSREGDVLHLALPSGKSETVHLTSKVRLRPYRKQPIALAAHDYLALWTGKEHRITRGSYSAYPIGQARVTLHAVLQSRRSAIVSVTTVGTHPIHVAVWLTPQTRIVQGTARTSPSALKTDLHVTVRGARYGAYVVASLIRIPKKNLHGTPRRGHA